MIHQQYFKRIATSAFVICILASLALTAQTPGHSIICGNEIFHDLLERHYPTLLDNINQTFNEAKQSPRGHRSDPLNVNVVVHIIWNEEEENLDDAIIQSQMAVFNNDFNKLNSDTNNLRPLFKPVAGNANIHFNLAGVVRVHTNELFSVDILGTNLLTEVKHDLNGGSDAWDPDQYINIWVCKIQPLVIFGLEVGQLFGFSFPPNNLPNWPMESGAPSEEEDGLVIDYRVFGANNPTTIIIPGTTDLLIVSGRTPVHEMGHYLGLRHIWGDGGTFGPNDCAQSDGIDDTPFADSQSNFDCDKSKNSCASVEPFYNADVPDLVENYMDYAAEDCMNMFTLGQVDLMRSILAGPRASLVADPSAVQDISAQNELSIFPNPSEDYLTVKMKDGLNEMTEISLYDFNGRVLFSKKENLFSENNPIGIDTRDLPEGIYLLQVTGLKGIYNSKIVVSRN